MTGPLLAEFRDPETLHHALAQVKQARHRALDAFTPYPVEGLAEELGIGNIVNSYRDAGWGPDRCRIRLRAAMVQRGYQLPHQQRRPAA